jgi:tetratricopeptide (TPR) repeat protein
LTDVSQASQDEEIARLTATIADFRQMMEQDPGTLFPAHADALLQLGSLLAAQGAHAEALTAVADAVDLFRAMTEADADTYRVHFASALNNLASRLSDAGHAEEAKIAGNEAVHEARLAAAAHPENARFVLISGLVNQAGRRLRDGEAAGAVADLTSAVGAFREAGPSATPFLGDMIQALHRTSMAFSEQGRWVEAIDTRRLMADLFMEAPPPAVIHLLALTLQQAAQALGRDGDSEDALACADEAVELGRSLVKADAAAYTLFLAQALGSQATCRHAMGESKGGLDAALEAVNLFHEAVQDNPTAAVPALILTLEALSGILTSLGMTDQAATVDGQRAQLLTTLESLVQAV